MNENLRYIFGENLLFLGNKRRRINHKLSHTARIYISLFCDRKFYSGSCTFLCYRIIVNLKRQQQTTVTVQNCVNVYAGVDCLLECWDMAKIEFNLREHHVPLLNQISTGIKSKGLNLTSCPIPLCSQLDRNPWWWQRFSEYPPSSSFFRHSDFLLLLRGVIHRYSEWWGWKCHGRNTPSSCSTLFPEPKTLFG